MEEFETALASVDARTLQAHSLFSRDVLGFAPGQLGLVANGKVRPTAVALQYQQCV